MTNQAPITNDNLILVCGESGTGKSACLRNLENVLYLNCESGKKLPFKPKNFKQIVITDPYQIYEAFNWAENKPEYQTIVIDGLNFLMDMFESVHVLTSSNTMTAWGAYAQFFKNLMQQYVASSTKNVIITAHVKDFTFETGAIIERKTKVPIKGALGNQGIEPYFSCIIATKKIRIEDLEAYKNDMLDITPRETAMGFKHVFQTGVTASTIHEQLRGAIGLFEDSETFIDNDISLVLKRLHEFYS